MDGFPSSMGNLVYLLDNGNYLIQRSLSDSSTGTLHLALSLFDSNFEEIKELDRFTVIEPVQSAKIKFPMFVSVWFASENRIYIGNEDNGYEIHVYDLEGNLLRKMRKKYTPVRVSEDYKKDILNKMESALGFMKEKISFPAHFPPFNCLFIDDQENLYVKTFEKGIRTNERVFYVFSSEGIIQGRVSMEPFVNDPFFIPGAPLDSWVVTKKKNRLYNLREKSSGYKEFVVYRWD